MTDVLVKPAFVSALPDTGDTTRLGPNAWNAARLFSAGALGDLLYRDTGSATGASWLPDVATGSVLVSGGVGAAPAWSASPTLTSLTLGSAGALAFSSDVLLTRGAANTLVMRNASANQAIQLGPAASFVSVGDIGNGLLQILNASGTGASCALIFGDHLTIGGSRIRNDGGGFLSILKGDASAFGGVAAAQFLVSNVTVIRDGTGTPEGAVTAPVGSIFLRTNGGAGTTLYVKESGSGNTGWTPK